jgi:hypothetical protein
VVHGRAFASNGAVTLDHNTFTDPTCLQNVTATSGGGTATTAPGSATTLPGGGTATTVPGRAGPTLPGTPSGSPGVPPVAGPPRTGGVPLHSTSFPWFAALIAGLLGTAALGGTFRARRAHARHLIASSVPSGPPRR